MRAVIFDCFGVLTSDLWHEFTATLEPGQAKQVTEINHQYDAGFITENDFFEGVRLATGRELAEIQAARNSQLDRNPGLFDYIRQLKGEHKIGLLSNVATPWIRDSFLTDEERALFDDMLFSYEVGITKPNPVIFHLAADRLKIDIKDCILIDDGERNCLAAQNEGMQAIAYKNLGQMKQELEQILAKS
jgi:HAD superfamily hydrolase (TIGR01509 family)